MLLERGEEDHVAVERECRDPIADLLLRLGTAFATVVLILRSTAGRPAERRDVLVDVVGFVASRTRLSMLAPRCSHTSAPLPLERRDANTRDEIRPRGTEKRSQHTRDDDRAVREDVVARGQECGVRETAAVLTISREHDEKVRFTASAPRRSATTRPQRAARARGTCSRPSITSRGRYQQQSREHHADACAGDRRPAERNENQEIDRSVFQEVDAVGEQRDRSDASAIANSTKK